MHLCGGIKERDTINKYNDIYTYIPYKNYLHTCKANNMTTTTTTAKR